MRDPLRLLIFVLTIVTISRVHLHYPMLARLRPVLLLSLAAVGYAYLNPRQLTTTNVLNVWPMRLVAGLGLLACASAAFGISLGNSARFILESYIKTLAYSFLLAVSIRYARDLYTYIWAFAISCGILTIFSLFVFDVYAMGDQSERLGEMYTYDSNDLGVIMMIGLPLSLLLLGVERGGKRWLLILNILGMCAAMARAGSRGGLLGLIAVSIAALFLANAVSAARRILLLSAALLALATAAPSGYWNQMSTILSPTQDYNYSNIDGRAALIKRGIGYMVQYPVFGIGIWNFAKAECSISPKIRMRPANGPLRCSAPHNSFVQAGTELGVPGLFLWSSLLFGGIIAPIRARRRIPRAWQHGSQSERFLYGATGFLPVAMIGFAVTSFFVSFAFGEPLYVLAALTTGLYIAIAAELNKQPQGASSLEYAPTEQRRLPGWRVRAGAWRSFGGAQNGIATG